MAMRGVGLGVVAGLVAGSLAMPALGHPLGQYIYRDGNDRLVMVFPYQNYWPLTMRLPPYAGVMDNNYPFEEAQVDRPSQGLYRPLPGSKIEVVLAGFAPGFWIRDPFDITVAHHEPGERLTIGTTGMGFLTFPYWHLDEDDPEFVPGLESYSASYSLHDVSGVHGDSEVYTFNVYPSVGFCPADMTTTAIVGAPGYGIPNQTLSSDDFFYYLIQFVNGHWTADLTHSTLPGSFGYGVPDGFVTNDDFFYYTALYVLGC